MLIIRNRTARPITIHVFGGKTLHLGPLKTGEVSDQTASMPSFRRLIDEGTIEQVGTQDGASQPTDGTVTPHEATHGHKPPTVVMPKGNR
jgi:hypothetical protein